MVLPRSAEIYSRHLPYIQVELLMTAIESTERQTLLEDIESRHDEVLQRLTELETRLNEVLEPFTRTARLAPDAAVEATS